MLSFQNYWFFCRGIFERSGSLADLWKSLWDLHSETFGLLLDNESTILELDKHEPTSESSDGKSKR